MAEKKSRRKTDKKTPSEKPESVLGLAEQTPEEISRKIKGEDGIARMLILMRRVTDKTTGKEHLELTEDGIKFITLMYRYGSTQAEVAAELGVSYIVLSGKWNRAADARAREIGHLMFANDIRKSQKKLLQKGDTKMAIWLGKNYLGQSDRAEHQVTVLKTSDPDDMDLDDMMAVIKAAEEHGCE